jgi:hypothetical protein
VTKTGISFRFASASASVGMVAEKKQNHSGLKERDNPYPARFKA